MVKKSYQEDALEEEEDDRDNLSLEDLDEEID